MSAVVVTGAAGFVGQRVLPRLATGDWTIVAVDAVPIPAPPGVSVDRRTIDLARYPSERLSGALAGAASVVHLAWSHAEPSPASPEIPFPNLAALRQVLRQAAAAGAGQLVFVSSATVYGAWSDNPVPLGEDAPLRPNPGFAYAIQKAESERMLAEWVEAHPAVAVAILRPSVTVGSSGPALYQALAGTRSPRAEASARPVQFLDVEDLAAAVVFALEGRLTGVYNVAPDGWLTEAQARTIVGGMARLRMPERLAATVASVGWRVLRTGTPTEARPYSLHPWVVANDRLRAAGWAPTRSNEEALRGSDQRSPWSDLSLSRRVKVALAAAGVGLVGALAATASVTWRILGRIRRRRRPGPRRPKA